ncbi:hypothetical protein PanWU01x14_342110, partial [Parasponia andersonii]
MGAGSRISFHLCWFLYCLVSGTSVFACLHLNACKLLYPWKSLLLVLSHVYRWFYRVSHVFELVVLCVMVWVSYLPRKGRLRFSEFMCTLVAFDSSNFWCLVFWGLAVAAGYMLVCHDNPLFIGGVVFSSSTKPYFFRLHLLNCCSLQPYYCVLNHISTFLFFFS